MVYTGKEEPVEDELMKFETVKQGGKEIEFDKVKASDLGVKNEYRRIPVPQHRYTPLRQNWDSILKTLVEHMKLQVRMNTKRRAIEIKVSIFRPTNHTLVDFGKNCGHRSDPKGS